MQERPLSMAYIALPITRNTQTNHLKEFTCVQYWDFSLWFLWEIISQSGIASFKLSLSLPRSLSPSLRVCVSVCLSVCLSVSLCVYVYVLYIILGICKI